MNNLTSGATIALLAMVLGGCHTIASQRDIDRLDTRSTQLSGSLAQERIAQGDCKSLGTQTIHTPATKSLSQDLVRLRDAIDTAVTAQGGNAYAVTTWRWEQASVFGGAKTPMARINILSCTAPSLNP